MSALCEFLAIKRFKIPKPPWAPWSRFIDTNGGEVSDVVGRLPETARRFKLLERKEQQKIETRATCTADEEHSDEGRRVGAYRWLLVNCRSASFGGGANRQ